ncbi:hypothetical protein GCM10023094_55180 [Rhodococcus olei]|uniref:MinD-like ATPase involved in chromosome partitioning or flagellar assembly n=1 Tax=Rhodococcus olei TaxID=2161675 RepID=A0ABP8PS78_9NOCA
MTTTVDVEITSKTTARATLADADVPPMDLVATEYRAIGEVVHEFVRTLAEGQELAVEVVYKTGKNTRYLTVGADGKVVENAPSVPMPVVTLASELAAQQVSAAPAGPVVVAAEPLAYDAPTERAPEPAQTAPKPGPDPIPTPAAPRPAQAPTAPTTGPLDALGQLAAPRPNPEPSEPARIGLRGRLNAVLGLKLAPKTDSLEMRLRDAQSTIARPLPEAAVITFANLKGGVGKTPMSISLAETLAEYRGPATVTCVDLGEVDSSFADRVAVPPTPGQDAVALLAGVDPTTEVRPSTLARFLTRQPSGSYVIAGRPGAETPLGRDDAAALGAILGQHRDVLIADTGNSSHAGSWRWAIAAAHAVVVPVPLRRDAAAAAQRTLAAITANRPDVMPRTIVVITDGPGDAPIVETEAVDAFSALGVPVCRMPYDPLFASGERIALTHLRPQTRDALTVLAATVVGLMAGAVG